MSSEDFQRNFPKIVVEGVKDPRIEHSITARLLAIILDIFKRTTCETRGLGEDGQRIESPAGSLRKSPTIILNK